MKFKIFLNLILNNKYKSFFILFITVVIVMAVLISEEKVDDSQILTPYDIKKSKDSDGDNAPDWLELITGTDQNDKTSSPDRAYIEQEIHSNTPQGEGPSAFLRDVARRLESNVLATVSPVTDREKERFVEETTDFFIQRAIDRPLPEFPIFVDKNVNKKELLSFLNAGFLQLRLTTEENGEYIEETILKAIGNDSIAIKKLEKINRDCREKILKVMPNVVTPNIKDDYEIVIGRIVNLCEAVRVALTERNSNGTFYVFNLLFNPEIGIEKLLEEYPKRVQNILNKLR